MNNNIQCSIESSTTKIELNSAVDGVFLVPELEGLVGLPEIRTTSGVNAGYDGGWTSAQHYDARLISIRGIIASPDISKVEDKRRAIASLLGQGRKEQLTLRFTTEAGNAYAISVRTISCEMALQRVLTTQEFLIQLRADDPLIYDDGAAGGIAAILQPQRALGGFEINFELPLAIGGGAEDTVVDNGNETVYPVIKLYGALHSPTVVNRTTNQQMQILADLQYSIDWHTYRSATGDYILVNGGLDGAPMTLSQFFGNAEQTGTPTPDSPQPISTVTGEQTVKITGKNLQPTTWAQDFVDAVNNSSIASIETFDSKNCLEYSPSAGYGDYQHKNFTLGVKFKENTQYTISFDEYSTASNRHAAFYYTDGTYSTYTATSANTWTRATMTSTAGKTVAYVAPYYTSGTTYIDIGTIQLELGSTATAYEPYQGQSYEVDLSLASKNMLNPAWMTAGFISVNGDITPNQSQGESACQYFIPVEPNTEYTFEIFATSDAYPTWIGIGEYSTASESGFTTRVTNTSDNYLTFTTASNAHFIRPSARNLQHATKYMLSKGSRTTYEPYFELAKVGDYQDRIYRSNGKWYIEKQVGKVVLDGTESTWGIFGNNNAFYSGAYDVQTPSSTTTAGAIMANYYTADSESNIYNARVDYGIGVSGERRILVRNKDITTVADFRAWLSTHNTTVYYALATPTTTEITDETLLLQLNFLASLYEGVNNISLVGTGVQGEMVIRYATDYTVNQDIITIDSQARTITLNGQDIYHLKTSESEFLVLAPGENKLYLTSEVSDDSGYAEVKFKQGYLSI